MRNQKNYARKVDVKESSDEGRPRWDQWIPIYGIWAESRARKLGKPALSLTDVESFSYMGSAMYVHGLGGGIIATAGLVALLDVFS